MTSGEMKVMPTIPLTLPRTCSNGGAGLDVCPQSVQRLRPRRGPSSGYPLAAGSLKDARETVLRAEGNGGRVDGRTLAARPIAASLLPAGQPQVVRRRWLDICSSPLRSPRRPGDRTVGKSRLRKSLSACGSPLLMANWHPKALCVHAMSELRGFELLGSC